MFGFAGIYGSASLGGNSPITFIDEYPTAYDVSSTKTYVTNLNMNSGDVLIATGGSETATFDPFYAYKTGIDAFSSETQMNMSDFGDIFMSYYRGTMNEITTVTQYYSGVYNGGNLLRFRGVRGIGNIETARSMSGFPSLDITCSAGSCVVMAGSDWSAVAGTQTFTNTGGAGSPTSVTGYAGDGSHLGFAIAYYLNVGVAGVKTLGMSSPSGQRWQAIAFELLN